MVGQPEHGFRRVMHCDLDSFFASVEILDDPSLSGKPVIVGGDPDRRGVVSTANYIARRYGVHSAMSAAVARRLCPEAVFLRPRFDRYRELSALVMTILDDYFVVREQVSIDEAYGELPPGLPGCRRAEDIAREIKARVRSEVGLVISIGVGCSKSIAKLASDLSKPDGCLIVKPGTEASFLQPLPVGRISGVGPHTRERLERLGLSTVGQLASADPADLERTFGKHGRQLWMLANGQDDRPVVSDHGPPKSISHENTYERDIADMERASAHVYELSERVARRAVREDVIGTTVTLKVKWSDFRLMTRQRPLPQPTSDAALIADAALALLDQDVAPMLADGAALRLLGVGLSGIISRGVPPPPSGIVQLPLFDDADLLIVGED
ncbi:MAG TPA: DNA polymerase IV [Ktedonobacterales bacterium]